MGVWRWRNVPVPEAHVGGLVVGAGLHLVRPWPLPMERPLALVSGGMLVALGLATVAWAVLAAGRDDVAAPTALVTDGPYRYSRNPMYVGWSGLYLGIALVAGATWPLAVFPVVAVVVHREVRREERALERQFGEVYRRYRQAVRRYL